MKYTAINIGPIVSTLMMARRPRELWSASYLFSHLMRCVIDNLPDKERLISPAILLEEADLKLGVGLYPDRIFIKGEVCEPTLLKVLNGAWNEFKDSTKVKRVNGNKCDILELKENYFNLMVTSCEADSETKAIKILNKELDKLELINYALDEEARTPVIGLLKMKDNSPLIGIATSNNKLPIESLGEIAAIEKKQEDEDSREKWDLFRSILLNEKKKEDDPYTNAFGSDYKSYHKYICVVQADGDNVGKTVSHEKLPDGKVKKISEALLAFGIKAKKKIDEFGGLPIYAGGDDLLFIAPVIGRDHTTILDLLDTIDSECFSGVADVIDCLGLQMEKTVDGKQVNVDIKASLSYGISITYYKYPLYEALASARDLLFGVAKNIDRKNALALKLRKHSGSGFEVAFSKGDKELKEAFNNLVVETSDGNTVTAVAHKICANEVLVNEVMKSDSAVRLNALFEKLLECKGTPYFDAVKKLMPELYKTVGKDKFATTLYNMLRTAKFIKGEDPIDE